MIWLAQHVKKVVSDNPGLVHFAKMIKMLICLG